MKFSTYPTILLLFGLVLFPTDRLLAERRGTLGIFGKRSPEVLYSVKTSRFVVALTIDDGPDPETTPRLLELLEAQQAKATFFLITNRISGNEDIVRKIVTSGHEIGNHMTQDESSIDLAPAEFERKLLRAHSILSKYAEPRWFRPGSGWYDEIMLEILASHGYRCALGSIYPVDAHVPWSWLAQKVILRLLKPGAVIILHDVGNRGKRTLITLSKVLPLLRDRGYLVVNLSELIEFTAVH